MDEIFHSQVANAFGLLKGQVTVMIHSGSRGLGYEVCDDSLAFMTKHVKTLGIELPDRQMVDTIGSVSIAKASPALLVLDNRA